MERLWILLAIALCGCPSVSTRGFSSGPGGLGPALELRADLSVAELLVEYAGRVELVSGDPASFSMTGGALPPGLDLREDGMLRGAPSYLGSYSFTVTATLASGASDSLDLTLLVEPGATEVFAGYPRNPFVSYSGMEYLGDLWVRIDGGGVDGWSSVVLDPGFYVPGPNGVFDGGGGDDVRVGDLTLGVDASLGLGQWSPTNDGEELDEPTWDEAAATLTAGEQAGRLSLSFSAEGYIPTATFLSVIPPDWCPKGEHVQGGPSPGVCQ